MTWLTSWRFWLGGGVSLFCLWLAFRQVPLGQLTQLITHVHPLLLLAAVGVLLLSIAARAQRWVVLLNQRERLLDSFWAQGIGYLFTNILPLRMGEPARVLVMSERCQLPLLQVAASAIVERLLDAAANVFILVLVLPWMQVPPFMSRVGVSFGLAVLVGMGMLLLVARFNHRSERLVQALCARFPLLRGTKLLVRWRELIHGFLPLLQGRVALQATGWSLVAWACSVAMFWCVLRAFQDNARVEEAAFMMVALSFAIAVPSSPGFIGVFQLIGQQALVFPFGAKYNAANALAITLTVHLTYYIVTTTLGVIGLWRMGESFVHLGQVIAGRKADRKTQVGEAVQ